MASDQPKTALSPDVEITSDDLIRQRLRARRIALTGKQPVVNTLHVAVGAIVLVSSLVLTLRAYRPRIEGSRAAAPSAADLASAAPVRPAA